METALTRNARYRLPTGTGLSTYLFNHATRQIDLILRQGRVTKEHQTGLPSSLATGNRFSGRKPVPSNAFSK